MSNEYKISRKLVLLSDNPLTLPVAASDPGSASNGDLYYNSVSHDTKVYSNGVWTGLLKLNGTNSMTGNLHVPELRLDGSSSGYVGLKSPASPTSYIVTMPSAQGAASTFLQNDGSGNLSWIAITGYANQSLSNLTSPTAINQNLLPDASANNRELGGINKEWSDIWGRRYQLYNSGFRGGFSTALSIPSGAVSGAQLYASNTAGVSFRTLAVITLDESTADATASGSIRIETGNKTAGTGSSGDIVMRTGTSSGGTRGTVQVSPELQLNGSTSGYVGLKAPSTPTSYTVTMPSAQGAASTVLTNDGSGNLSWATSIIESLATVSLSDNTTDNVFTIPYSDAEYIVIDYSIVRGSTKETGTIHMVADSSQVNVTTTSSYIGTTGVKFSGDNVGGTTVRLRYTTTSTGSGATMKYVRRKWK